MSRMPHRFAKRAMWALPALALLGRTVAAQTDAVVVAAPLLVSAPASGSTSAVSYDARFDELQSLSPIAAQVADVHGLALRRDVGEWTLKAGTLYALSPVGSRTVAVLFTGTGQFKFTPPSLTERNRLMRFERTPQLDVAFTDLFLLFADSTFTELSRQAVFKPADVPGAVRRHVKDGLEVLLDADSRSFDPDLMGAFLNGESSDLFFARIERVNQGSLMFMINPNEVEAVRLFSHMPRASSTTASETICRFPRAGATAGSVGDRIRQTEVRRYAIETTLRQTGVGVDLSFVATAKMELGPTDPAGGWTSFRLFSRLKVDSARWSATEQATVFRGKDAHLLWVKLPPRPDGAPLTLVIHYHGDLIDRYGNFFYIKSSSAWYPLPLDGRAPALFDLTFHSPSYYLLASVADRVDSSTTGQVTTTRWVSPKPMRNASFNLGIFKGYRIAQAGIPPVTVMVSEEGHRALGQSAANAGAVDDFGQGHMGEVVGADVVHSIEFFQHVYGPLPVKELYATEIPYYHGEAFPGMIDLSWVTFHHTDPHGEDQVFRAHEVAHQWWGIGVDYATYHDRWISEGFADFSGLWYMQVALKDTRKYFGVLDIWRAHLLLRRDEPSPISLGDRTATSKDEQGYNVIVYQKGAWVLHMLRMLMLDMGTMNDDRFIDTMRDFFTTYVGRRASTGDFQRIVEKHTGADMGWFFHSWVDGTGIPTYRVATRTEKGADGRYHVDLKVDQENVPDDFQMYVPVGLQYGSRTSHVRVKVAGPHSEIELPSLDAPPDAIKFNELSAVLAEVKEVGWKN